MALNSRPSRLFHGPSPVGGEGGGYPVIIKSYFEVCAPHPLIIIPRRCLTHEQKYSSVGESAYKKGRKVIPPWWHAGGKLLQETDKHFIITNDSHRKV